MINNNIFHKIVFIFVKMYLEIRETNTGISFMLCNHHG